MESFVAICLAHLEHYTETETLESISPMFHLFHTNGYLTCFVSRVPGTCDGNSDVTELKKQSSKMRTVGLYWRAMGAGGKRRRNTLIDLLDAEENRPSADRLPETKNKLADN